MSRLARFLSRHPWRAVAAAALLTVLGFALSGAVSSRLTNSISDYDDPSSPSSQARVEVQHATGVDIEEGYTLLVSLPQPVALSQTPPARVDAAVRLLRNRPEVAQVTDAWSSHLPSLISDDGRTAVVEASLRPVDEKTVVDSLQASIDSNALLRGHVLLGGSTALDVQATAQSSKDLTFAETIALPILLVLLLLIFRGVVAALLPLAGALVSIGLTTLLLLAAASATHVSVYALNLVYALGIGLSIDFNLLIVSRYREEMDRRGPGIAALERTVSSAGRTVLFSAATVTAALGALLLFPIPAISSMGLAGMLVTICAAANAVLVLPAVLWLLGSRVDALPLLRRRRQAAADTSRGFWIRLSRLVMHQPVGVAVLTAAVLLAAGSLSLGVTFSGYNTKELPSSLPGTQVATRLSSDFRGLSASPLQLVIDGASPVGSEVRAYMAAVADVPGVESVATPVQVGSSLWEVDAALRGQPLSPGALATLDRVRAIPTPLAVRPTGYTAAFADEETSLGSHLPAAAGLLAITTLLVLFALTGSVVLPLKALVMNALTLAATLGLLVLVFQGGFLSGVLGFTPPGGIDIETPVLVGSLAFGLSTDYGVFLLSRIREEHLSGLATRDAVAVGLQRVGRVVTAAAALFCIAVGALVLSTTVVLKEIGLGAALAVLIDASIVRALLVPSVMALLGRWNWWAPHWLAELHRRLRVDGLESEHEPAAA
jgi:uncharacterized membrane protein YdfJ with MMPL/SSD domain